MLALLLRRYGFFLFEACYVKHVCDTVHMSNWGRVYYTNLLSGLVLLAVFPLCHTEHKLLQETHFSHSQLFLLFLSCAVGVCMSHAGGCCQAGPHARHASLLLSAQSLLPHVQRSPASLSITFICSSSSSITS
jgi:hypothetical protein